MLFLNKDGAGLQTVRIWMGFALVALICLFCVAFVDRTALLAVHEYLPAAARLFFEKVTRLGLAEVWLIPGVSLAAGGFLLGRSHNGRVRRPRAAGLGRQAAFFCSAIITSGLALNIIKTVIGRYRPRYFLADGIYGFQPFNFDFSMNTFPSGHSQTIWAAMIALSLLFPRGMYVFLPFAVLVAASRVLVEAHFVGDVLMGSYLGFILTLYVYVWFVRRGYLSAGEAVPKGKRL